MTAFLDRHQKSTALRLDHLPPQRAGDIALKRFCLPHLSSRRSADHTVLAERARFHLRNARWVSVPTTEGAIQAYVFEPETTERGGVIIAHGWTSEASFMAVFAEQLRRAGFRVVAFDQPGHGKSAQRHASLVDCARALIQVADALGPVRYAVAHSMGGLAVLMAGEGRAMPRPCPFERYVLVSSPNKFTTITREFGDELGLDAHGLAAFERHLARIAHRSVASFSAVALLQAIGRPALVLHAKDDMEVPVSNGEEIAAGCRLAQLRLVDGLGHRNILFAPPVIRGAISYLTSG